MNNTLYVLCAYTDREPNEESWNNIRVWLNANKHGKKHFKEAAYYTDASNNTPLHMLAGSTKHLPVDILETLIRHAPETLRMKNDRGHLPLHLASYCADGVSGVVIRMLLDAYRVGAQLQDDDGCLPLYHACRYEEASVDVVRMLLQAYPVAAQLTDTLGFLPIHCACGSGASLEVLNMLIQSYPDSIDIQSNNGDKPSFYLRDWAAYVKKDWGSVHNGNYWAQPKDHDSLLHKAVAGGFTVYLVKLLVETFPEQCVAQDGNGKTPLHLASSLNTPDSIHVVLALLEANPKNSTIADDCSTIPMPSELFKRTASYRDKKGMLLLHHKAAQGALTTGTLQFLLKAYPGGIALPDKHGMLPFHHAALNENSSLDVLKLFFTLCPESIFPIQDFKSDAEMKLDVTNIKSDRIKVKSTMAEMTSEFAEMT